MIKILTSRGFGVRQKQDFMVASQGQVQTVLMHLRLIFAHVPVADRGGESGPVKISHKKMAPKCGCIHFKLIGPSPTGLLDPLLGARF